MEKCDLHTHSKYSDGTDTPTQVIEAALRQGLAAAALTDHNTIQGLPEFLQAAEACGIEGIPGVEISTGYMTATGEKEIHIVGLFIRPETYDRVTEYVSVINRRKEESNRTLVKNLAKAGYVLDYDEIRSNKKGSINRAVIAAELMEKGYVTSVEEAFAALLGKKRGYFIPPQRIPALEAIAFLKSIGAVPVLAHPFLSLTEEELREFLPKAKEQGLAAMETRYSKYDEETTETAIRMARAYGLMESGGSDYHGSNKPDIQIGSGQGALEVPIELLRKMQSDDCFIL